MEKNDDKLSSISASDGDKSFKVNEKINKKKKILNKKKKNKIEEIKNLDNMHIIYFFLSQYGFPVLLVLIFLLFQIIPQYHSSHVYTSKINPSKFDTNILPTIFLHITDIHISLTNSKKLDGSTIFLTSFYEYKPDLILLTGDAVENKKKGERIGLQSKPDWNVYNTSVRKFLERYPIIDVAGNHDIWGVDKLNSSLNNFLDFSFIFNRSNVLKEEDFFIRKIKKFGITFILLNEYTFPVVHPPYGGESHVTSKHLTLLENMIDSLDPNEECYILTHYNIDRAILSRSKNKKSIQEIISNKKVAFIFTGHYHPKSVGIVHHGQDGGLEFCTPSAFDHKKGGLITIDNGNLIYHEVYIPYIGKKPLFFVTYPVPNEQISSHHIFNLNDFEIRVLSYAPEKNIHLKIEGDITGNLEYCNTLKNGAFLYKYPVHLNNGTYKIHIYDTDGYSCDIKLEFTIGEKYKGKKEKYFFKLHNLFCRRFLLIPFFIYLLIIILPINSEINLDKAVSIEQHIKGDRKSVTPKYLICIYSIILGPFILRNRFQANQNILKNAIFIALIYPLVLPIHFFEKMNGMIGYSFFIFIVMGNKIRYEHWSVQLTLFFYCTIIYPYVLICCGKRYYHIKIIRYINLFFVLILFILAFVINFLTIGQSLSLKFLFFSTAYVIIWLVLLILFIIYF